MKVTIYGAGYVGLVTGVCFAEVGHDVVCMDVDNNKIAKLQQGQSPIYEPGLNELLEKNLAAGRLHFTTNVNEAANHGLFQFIAVGTPPDEDGSADLQYVLAVAKNIGQHMQEYKIIVTKSTVPVGTSDKVTQVLQQELSDKKLSFAVLSNPEFLKEGMAIKDFMQPDRVVVGGDNADAIEQMRLLYQPLLKKPEQFIAMDIRSSELTKYAANAMLATKISFINELSQIAEKLGADIENVRQGIATDRRIGPYFIRPGCGYGGSCFPKDVNALRKSAMQVDVEPKLLAAVETVNHDQKRVLFHKINDHFNQDLTGKTFALWGLAFKPNTDDMREAPSRVLLEQLWQAGAKVQAYDPVAAEEAQRIFGDRNDLQYCPSAVDALKNADALIIVTEWDEFKEHLQQITQHLRKPIIFDGRNMFDPAEVQALNIIYYSMGRSLTYAN